ncbi:head GIN domain-containing protein [Solimicrobium silvestre]|uniref:Putative auto-transporter adhesin head GIN domain-containing protein n=1 Tax=Solimicrobium silvestre TaxID=2099400 RepID=A0A2S9GT03_9BURK|nr:head GIN domain-containing protein [Solimicrobium silvestre]PRC90847.1 hypothetical protein S2091_4428 [Solimicrobium silvestre]
MRRLVILSLLFLCSFANADQTYQFPAFNAVKSEGVFDIVITAGSAQSVVATGSDAAIKKLSLSVVDGQLLITSPDEKHGSIFSTTTKVTITVPALRLFKGKGVSSVVLKNIDGDRIDIGYEGVGNLEASGKIKWLRLKANGVGDVDTKKLLAENADVDFDGVGSVEMYASNHLNVVAHGVGSVTYYGNPHSIDKSIDGIGGFSAGK